LWLTGNWQEELELWWELVLGVQSVGEIDSSNSAVSMNLNSKSLYVVGSVSSPGEIGQVELNLIPALIESHGHCADEWLHSGSGLVVGGSEPTSDTLIIEYLHLKSEVLLQVLDDHDQERKLDGQGLLWVQWGIDVVGGHIGTHDLEHGGLNIWISDSLDVTVSHLFVPDLEWFRSITA
jgi:hypothetical protein